MKIWIMSDLHLEFGAFSKPLVPPDADICIVAGDVFHKGITPSINWIADTLAPHMPVIFVAGNHEFYKSSMCEAYANAIFEAAKHPNLHFLENRYVMIDKVCFAGATLWTDYNLFGFPEIAMAHAYKNMNDYKQIKYQKNPFQRFSPRKALYKYLTSKAFFEQTFKENLHIPIVIISHHAPSLHSVAPADRSDFLSAAYASHLDSMIEHYTPVLWVHGHIHHAQDYYIGKTRILSNPRGYSHDPSALAFNPQCVIEI